MPSTLHRQQILKGAIRSSTEFKQTRSRTTSQIVHFQQHSMVSMFCWVHSRDTPIAYQLLSTGQRTSRFIVTNTHSTNIRSQQPVQYRHSHEFSASTNLRRHPFCVQPRIMNPVAARLQCERVFFFLEMIGVHKPLWSRTGPIGAFKYRLKKA